MDFLEVFQIMLDEPIAQMLIEQVDINIPREQRVAYHNQSAIADLFEHVIRLHALLHAPERELKDGYIMATVKDRKVAESLLSKMKGGILSMNGVDQPKRMKGGHI